MRKIMIVIPMMIIISFLAGCGQASQPKVSDKYNTNVLYKSTNDFNHHSHMNATFNSWPTRSYDNQRDALLARRLTDEVEQIQGVRSARAIVNGDQLIIGIDPATNDLQALSERIRTVASRFSKDKTVQIVTNPQDAANLLR